MIDRPGLIAAASGILLAGCILLAVIAGAGIGWSADHLFTWATRTLAETPDAWKQDAAFVAAFIAFFTAAYVFTAHAGGKRRGG